MTRKRSPSRRSVPWAIELFQRHHDEDPDEAVPALLFLESCPDAVAARLRAALEAVAAAPPPAFSGGGYWEAMHDDMGGYYEVRVDHRQTHYRLFCILERNGAEVGLGGPAIIVLDGRTKPFRTTLSNNEYAAVRRLGEEYRSRKPRSVYLG